MIRKVSCILGTLIFAAFAWLQIEDDNSAVYSEASLFDAIFWVLSYAAVALLFALGFFAKFPKWLYLSVSAVFCYHLVATIPGLLENLKGDGFDITKTGMNPDNSKVELTREFFGAIIALPAMAALWFFAKSSRHRKTVDASSPNHD